MKPPSDLDLPFFTYGMFRPGQIGFIRIRDLVASPAPTWVDGTLKLRDGVPLLKFTQHGGRVDGDLLEFHPGGAEEAYERIAELEPDSQYLWGEIDVQGVLANALLGKRPDRGSDDFLEPSWDSWRDPLFTDALDLVDEIRQAHGPRSISDLKPLFTLQMGYLLLWSAIERYVSLRYRLSGDRAADKVERLADPGEAAFREALKRKATGGRCVHRADRPGTRYCLKPDDPLQSLRYYYQVRNNIMHRGKGVEKDYEHLEESLAELPMIFREVLAQAESDAAWNDQP